MWTNDRVINHTMKQPSDNLHFFYVTAPIIPRYRKAVVPSTHTAENRNCSIIPRYRKVVVPSTHTAENHDFISSDQGSRSSIPKSLFRSARSGNMLSR